MTEFSDRDAEALAFAEVILGAKLAKGEPPPGTFVYDLRRLVAMVDRGELSELEMYDELDRLHPERLGGPRNLDQP